MSEMEIIDHHDLPRDVSAHTQKAEDVWRPWPPQMTLAQVLQSVERAFLLDAINVHKKQSLIAKKVGISQPTVARRMKKYGLPPPFTIND
jgi:transcriptional regulator with PAS, ATPase and Fis domain